MTHKEEFSSEFDIYLSDILEKYPCLMKSEAGTIVLMYSDRVGTLLSEPIGTSMLKGELYHEWNMYLFTPFKGSITLEND